MHRSTPLILVFALAAAPARADTPEFEAPRPVYPDSIATTARRDLTPDIAGDDTGRWITVWSADGGIAATFGHDFDILFATSTDDGATWSAPDALNDGAADDTSTEWDLLPSIATDGAGRFVVVFEEKSTIGVYTTTDLGATWDGERLGNPDQPETEPHLAVSGGTWVAVWAQFTQRVDGTDDDWEILFARSTDGVGWSFPTILNTTARTDEATDRWPQITPAGDGRWMAVWESTHDLAGSGADRDILCALSTDDGVSWGAPRVVNTTAASDFLADEHPTITYADGAWIVAWSEEQANRGPTKLRIARSTDDGATWSEPFDPAAGVSTQQAEFADLAVDEGGRVVCVWGADRAGVTGTSETDLLIVSSTDGGATWTAADVLHDHMLGGSPLDSSDQTPAVAFANGRFLTAWSSTSRVNGDPFSDLDVFVSGALPDAGGGDPGDPGDEDIVGDDELVLTSGRFTVSWKNHAKERLRDKLTLQGRVDARRLGGAFAPGARVAMDLGGANPLVSDWRLDPKGRATAGLRGGGTAKLRIHPRTGALRIDVAKADLRALFPDVTDADATGTFELDVALGLAGSGLGVDALSTRVPFRFASTAGVAARGTSVLVRDGAPRGAFLVTKALAKSKDDGHAMALKSTALPEGAGALVPTGDVTITLGAAAPIEVPLAALTPRGDRLEVGKGVVDGLVRLRIDGRRGTLDVTTEPLAGTGLPARGDGARHDLAVRIATTTADGPVVFETVLSLGGAAGSRKLR